MRRAAVLLPLALAALLLAGCGSTTHTVLPPAPLGAGKGAVTLGLQWSPGRTSSPSAQLGLYVGVGARGVVGGTVTNAALPTSLSAAVYAPSGDGWLSARAHLQNLLIEQVGPTYEVEGAYAPASGDAVLRAGVGIVAQSPLAAALKRGADDPVPAPPPRLVLTLGADATYGVALASVEAHLGVNRARTRNAIAAQQHRLDALSREAGGLVLDAETVATVEASGEARFALITATLRDGRVLTVASRDPYPDCIACAVSLRQNGAYPSSPEARPVWISLSGERPLDFAHALDSDALLAGWRERGMLDLRLPADAADRAASGVPLLHDVSVLGGIGQDDLEGEAEE